MATKRDNYLKYRFMFSIQFVIYRHTIGNFAEFDNYISYSNDLFDSKTCSEYSKYPWDQIYDDRHKPIYLIF